MAESANYPQLPRSVWRGTWEILRKTPKRKLDAKALAAELNVQPTAAKAYARELVRLGILNEDYFPTDLANRWRQEGQASDVIDEILGRVYPHALLELAPRNDLNREKIVRWFMNEGLGEGSANNKASTFIMVSEGVSEGEETPTKKPKKSTSSNNQKQKGNNKSNKDSSNEDSRNSRVIGPAARSGRPDLNINIQIHISADASAEQIDAIFSSMKRYFDDAD